MTVKTKNNGHIACGHTCTGQVAQAPRENKDQSGLSTPKEKTSRQFREPMKNLRQCGQTASNRAVRLKNFLKILARLRQSAANAMNAVAIRCRRQQSAKMQIAHCGCSGGEPELWRTKNYHFGARLIATTWLGPENPTLKFQMNRRSQNEIHKHVQFAATHLRLVRG